MSTTTATALFSGNKQRSIETVEASGLNKVINDKPLTLEYLDLYDLEPLETQRVAKDTWVQQRLKDLGGLDKVAFGVLRVGRTPDGRNLIWDGLGSYNLAEHVGWTKKIPCIVFELTEQEAAFYFNYTQKIGRRNLSPEVLYVNAYAAGDSAAVELCQVMRQIDVFIQGQTNYPVPHPRSPRAIEVKYRTISEAYKEITRGLDDTTRVQVMHQARDLIATSFQGELILQQDLYWAVLTILVQVPKARSGATLRKLQNFLNSYGYENTQKQFTGIWKIKNRGTTGNSGASVELARELLTAWKQGKNSPDIRYGDLK